MKPYENDSAADWFGDLWDELPLPSKVEEALELDIEEFHEEIRAAIYILIQLGEVFTWPVDLIDRHCTRAIAKLEEIKRMEIYDGSNFQQQIQREIDQLGGRISKK